MINAGKCPKCDKTITNVMIEHVDVSERFQKRWHGASYQCPFCHTVLSVGLDPLSLKADIVSEVIAALKKR